LALGFVDYPFAFKLPGRGQVDGHRESEALPIPDRMQPDLFERAEST
jgi:hypothetical protein